jgi:hypothetical protein
MEMIERQRFNVKLLFVEYSASVAAREFLHGQFERRLQIRCATQ